MLYDIVQMFGNDSNKSMIEVQINRRWNSGNACYHSVQNLLSSRLMSKNIKIRIYKTIILPVVLYGCETWSLILSEEHRLRLLKNRVLKEIFGPKSYIIIQGWRKCIMRSFITCTLLQV
jgi:hypothetical protein